MTLTTPNRRFLIRLAISTTVWALSLTAARHVIGQGTTGGPLLWTLAMIPGLAMLGIFYAYGMLIIEQKDEFIRLLLIRQLIFGTGFALSFAVVWGFLESFGLVAHIYSYYFAVAWLLGWAFGAVVNKITHGAWGELS